MKICQILFFQQHQKIPILLFFDIIYTFKTSINHAKYSKRPIEILIKKLYSVQRRGLLVNKKIRLKKLIKEKELQIKKLHLHQSTSDVCGQLYNTLVLEKAILKKELAEMEKNPIIEAFKKIIPKREKLICDYFRN